MFYFKVKLHLCFVVTQTGGQNACCGELFSGIYWNACKYGSRNMFIIMKGRVIQCNGVTY